MELQKMNIAPVRNNYAPNLPKTEEKKAPKEVAEDNKKIATALAGLAAIAVAGVALKKSGAIGKIKDSIKNSADDAAKSAVKAAKNQGDDAAKKALEVAKERADDVTKQLAKGANYSQVREEATKNLTHEGKKIVKEAAKEGLDARRVQEAAQLHEAIAQHGTINQTQTVLNKAKQGLKNVKDNSVIQEAVKGTETAVETLQQAAKEAAKRAEANPTHKNIKYARQLANNVEEAIVEQKKIAQTAAKTIEKNTQKAMQHQSAVQAIKDNTTLQQAFDSQIKIREQQAKDFSKALQRQMTRDRQQPGYLRAIKKLEQASESKLRHIIETSTNQGEKLAASDLLAKILEKAVH